MGSQIINVQNVQVLSKESFLYTIKVNNVHNIDDMQYDATQLLLREVLRGAGVELPRRCDV